MTTLQILLSVPVLVSVSVLLTLLVTCSSCRQRRRLPAVNRIIGHEGGRRALAELPTIDEVMRIKDAAVQAALYARQTGDSALLDKASELIVRAERRCGELLVQAGAGRATLKDMGLTESQSDRYRQLAVMPADQFEVAMNTAKAIAHSLTPTSGPNDR